MKKFTVIILFLLFFAVGCNKVEEKDKRLDYITINIDASEVFDVKSIEYNIRTKDVTLGSSVGYSKNIEILVDNSNLDLSGKEDLQIEFTVADMQYDPNTNKSRKEYKIKEKIIITPQIDGEYHYKLSGDYDKGFSMTPQ